jgi:hypothetical protein
MPTMKITLLSLPQRSTSVLEFFFLSTGRSAFQRVEESAADVAIFDYDHLDSRQHWERYSTQFKRPGIMLSVAKQELPGVTWVQKPFTAATLLAAAHQLSQVRPAFESSPIATTAHGMEPKPATFQVVPVSPGAEPPSPSSKGPETAIPASSMGLAVGKIASATAPIPKRPREEPPVVETLPGWPAEEVFYCGVAETAEAIQTTPERRDDYEPDNYLISHLKTAFDTARKWHRPLRIELQGENIILAPDEDRLFSSLSTEALWELCARPLPKPVPKTRILNEKEYKEICSLPDLGELQEKIEGFVWRASLAASRGRLQPGEDMDRTVYLRHWPNLTRLYRTPHALRIAALWATRGASLAETSHLLRIPERYVFAFYNAAEVLGLITEDGSHIEQRRGKASKVGHKLRGLFSRLLHRLRGDEH